ncbi:MAG: threonine--tRNA ligase [Pseudomonadota bacterium]
MPSITLPDGSIKEFDQPVSGADIAASIGPGLAKAALALRIDGETRDLATVITEDTTVEIVTAKSDDEIVLSLLRHDAAHILAEAAQELYPGTQITFGPATEDGFYYDFARNEPFTPEDLEKIEEKMHEIVKRDEAITREIWDRDQVRQWFIDNGEAFKAEWSQEIPADEEISIYKQGDWLDMCTGPHLPSTGKLGHAFKLLRVSGAYWRGDPKNPQLQRIYGTAWRSEKELKAYLHRVEEAEKRDHRKLGRALDLFHIQEEAVGSVFWHPKGWTLYRAVEDYMRRRQEQDGYVEVKTPQLVDRALWERSGHWDKFRDNMFLAQDGKGEESERVMALKPMNCPGHVQIFRHGIKSYRDLPLRMAEFGSCHRFEPSGALHGIMRVRAFTQDDAHIFCREDQIMEESQKFITLLSSVYRDFGFSEFSIKFSDRPDVRAGSDDVWDRAEAALKEAVDASGMEYTLNPGEGAFYGPKLEFVLRDAIGRDWQCGTLQADFVLPERLDADYTDADGSRKRPVMLHRAIIGSFERFLGILIENFAGKFPIWLSPVQVVVATITNDVDDYAKEVHAALETAGLRAELDVRPEKINYKVREHSVAKTPVIFVVGGREAEDRKVAIRRLGSQGQTISQMDMAIASLREEAQPPA